MAIDEKLSLAVRSALAGVPSVSEVKMFGGIGFMLNGNMVVAASHRGLLVRVGKEGAAAALTRAGAAPMIMNGRTMEGYVRVAGVPLGARAVESWIRLGRAFVETLPAKAKKTAKRAKKASATPNAKKKPKAPRRI